MRRDVEVESVGENSFVPGDYWTPERAASAVERMVAVMSSPEMESLMRTIAEAAARGADPGAVGAELGAGAAPAPLAQPEGPIDLASCTVRRATQQDAGQVAALVAHGELPPLVIDEFIEGFCVVEHRGIIIGCGGLEFYDTDYALVRSVVVHERARVLHLGRLIARLLLEDARAFGAKEAFLFTMHAVGFWEGLGFRDLDLARFPEPVRGQLAIPVLRALPRGGA